MQLVAMQPLEASSERAGAASLGAKEKKKKSFNFIFLLVRAGVAARAVLGKIMREMKAALREEELLNTQSSLIIAALLPDNIPVVI